MTDTPISEIGLLFEAFLTQLRRHGFVIGVDHYLRLQQLLARVTVQIDPSELKTLLCPIFATSPEEQAAFYECFDTYLPFFPKPESDPRIRFGFARKDLGPKLQSVTVADGAQVEAGLETLTPSGSAQTRRKPRRKLIYAVSISAVLMLAAVVFWEWYRAFQQQGATRVDTPAPAPPPGARSLDERSVPSPKPVEGTTTQDWFRRLGVPLLVASPFLVLLVYEWRAYRRRTMLLQHRRGRLPPHSWPIRAPNAIITPYRSTEFHVAAQRLNRRQPWEAVDMDVAATVRATIAAWGFPQVRYRRRTRLPEYLLLIDRACLRDHQAELFHKLGQALQHDGIASAIYFFEGDPRVCSNEGGEITTYLDDLYGRYPTSRLVLFGDGSALIDPISGKLAEWTRILLQWDDRAILTPESPAAWGRRERVLGGEFAIGPATTQGLSGLADHLAQLGPGKPAKYGAGHPGNLLDLRSADLPRDLKTYLGPDCFRWLCACAIYPELHWELTLELASLSFLPATILSEHNLLLLARLPWFRSGSLPDELRWSLIQELTDEEQRLVRKTIINLLDRNPAAHETFAADRQRFEVFFQKFFLEDRGRNREARRSLKEFLEAGAEKDHVVIRSLESERSSWLDFVLPKSLRPLVYRRGVPILGMNTGLRFAAAAACAVVLFVGVGNRHRDDAAREWARIQDGRDLAAFEQFLRLPASGPYAAAAQQRIEQLEWEGVRGRRDIGALHAFIDKYPSGPHRDDAARLMEQLEWGRVNRNDLEALLAFQKRYPNSQQAAAAIERLRVAQRQSADAQAIVEALNRFARAYETKNVAELTRVWPGIPRGTLRTIRTVFSQARSISMQLRPVGPAQLSNDTAIVRCERSSVTVYDQPRQVTEIITVRLRHGADGWVIEGID
jgi:hypothetical protein